MRFCPPSSYASPHSYLNRILSKVTDSISTFATPCCTIGLLLSLIFKFIFLYIYFFFFFFFCSPSIPHFINKIESIFLSNNYQYEWMVFFSVVVYKIGKGTYNFSDYLPTILYVIVLYNDQLSYFFFWWSINLNLNLNLKMFLCWLRTAL